MRFPLFLSALFLLLLPLTAGAQTKSINQFYRKYKHSEEVFNITVPGWLIKLGAGIAKSQAETPEERAAFQMVKKFKKLKFMVMEDDNLVTPRDYNRLISGVQSESFEELLSVRSDGARINFYIRDKQETIKNMLILVHEADSFIMVSAKTKLKLEEIADLVNQALDGDLDNEEIVPVIKPQA